MTTLATTPTYPVPKRKVSITFTKTNVTADYIRVWITDAPIGSDERKSIEDSGSGRILFHEGDNLSVKQFTPSKGGTYRLATQEYTRSASHGGAYQDDPNAAPSATKVGSEYSLGLTIGQRMTMECGVGPDISTLVVYVFNDTIRATTLADQGEVTPTVKNGATGRAKIAEASTSVRSAALALAEDTVATATGNPGTILTQMVDEFIDHLTQATVHNSDDTDNSLDAAYASTITPETFPAVTSDLLAAIRRHYLNDNGLGPGLAGTDPSSDPPDTTPNPYHRPSGVEKFDFANMPLFRSVSGTAESYRALADIWRAHEAHRVSTTVHSNADTTNSLTALPSLLDVHYAFFVQLAALSPTVPDTQSSGAVQLMTQVGAIETDPS